jgi:small subunit ribosomal protein S2
MAVVTMKQLLDSGVHFGHQTRRWNPKMKRYILTERNGIYIIDLQQTLSYIDRAYEFVRETVAHGGTIMFVGTKKQAQEVIADEAARVNMPYVNQRWLGGMLTNFQTVHKSPAAPQGARGDGAERGASRAARRSEILTLTREKDKLEKTLGGIRDMTKVPSAVWIVDTKKEHIAVGEARKLKHPGRLHPGHQLRPGRGRLPDPGQRRRDPLRRAADQGHRARPPPTVMALAVRQRRWRRRRGEGRRRAAARRVGAGRPGGQASAGSDGASLTASAARRRRCGGRARPRLHQQRHPEPPAAPSGGPTHRGPAQDATR